MEKTMLGAILPGNSTVELKEFPIPKPGHGQVLVNTGIETLRSTGKSVEDIFKEVIGDAWEVE